jgi:DNA invertase Pin-like site-specific DNA recombinase
VVCRYEDRGISGGTTERPGYQLLLQAARSGVIQVIIVEDISRLWRNRAEFGARSAELEDLGINVVTCVGEDTRRDGWGLVMAIKGAIAEHARKEISFRTRRGLEGLALAGKSTGAHPVYGYSDPGHAQVVREIFEMRAAGSGLGRIAAYLNSNVTPAPRGGAWSKWGVRAVLSNPRYAGRVLWGRTETKGGARDSRHKRRVARSRPIVDRFDAALQLVSPELWARAQKAVDRV